VKSLVWLSEQVLQDCGTRCGVNVHRDVQTLRWRVENEGDSFLTITLPSFCKGFETALATGRLEPSLFPACRCKGGLPVFLRGFLSRIFYPDRRLREDACPDCILAVRQITLLHKKVLLPCTKRRERKAEQAFVACEKELSEHQFDQAIVSDFEKVSAIVISDILKGTPQGDPYEELKPRHGPGSTQEKVLGNAKYNFKSWHSRLEEFFPYTEYGIASLRNLSADPSLLERVKFLEPSEEPPVRVTFVPKTLKSPRVIAIEPVCMQYAQQALWTWLAPLIESGRFTAGRVNFSDQTINQRLARQASVNGRFATIDLSEASDRVHQRLVKSLLRVAPALSDMVFACRSTSAKLPSKLTLTLEKFASAGSALCFPMEALVFFNAIVAHRIRSAQLPINASTVQQYSRDVYVYGDDIIVPVDEAPSICTALKLIGLKVNTAKSFWTGKFRESCGMDAYDGIDVTPVYCRRLFPANRRSPKEIVSWIEMANNFYRRGFWSTAKSIREAIEKLLNSEVPHLEDTSPGVGWTSYSKTRTVHRWNSTLHRFETKAMVVVPTKTPDPLDGDGALLKAFHTAGEFLQHLGSILVPKAKDAKAYLETARRGALTLKLQWVPA